MCREKLSLHGLKSVLNYGKCEINKAAHVAPEEKLQIYYMKWHKFAFNARHTYAR